MLETKSRLGAKAIGRQAVAKNEDYELKESQAPYNRVSDPEKSGLIPNNGYFWNKY